MNNFIPVRCHLCGKNSFTVMFKSTLVKTDFAPEVIATELKNTLGNYKKHSRIVRCKSCDLVYTNPMETPQSLLRGYQDVEDPEYLRTEKYRKLLLVNHLQHIMKFKSAGRLLDIGCFAGYFLELAKKEGWKTEGIEPSVWASKLAKKRKVNIIGESVEKVKLQPHHYDVITMWDVIEHLSDPKKILKKCYQALAKDGIIALGTPNIDCLVAKIMGSNYPYILRMHLLFFSPKTLQKMLKDVGFTTVEIYSYGRIYPISYILERMQITNIVFTKIKNFVNSTPKIANFTINLNIGDSFVIIAKK